MGLIKRGKCRKCGKDFFVGELVSDYCQDCLKKYPELKQRTTTCFAPRCKHLGKKTKPFLLSLRRIWVCKLHDREFSGLNPFGVLGCPDHAPTEEPYKIRFDL